MARPDHLTFNRRATRRWRLAALAATLSVLCIGQVRSGEAAAARISAAISSPVIYLPLVAKNATPSSWPASDGQLAWMELREYTLNYANAPYYGFLAPVMSRLATARQNPSPTGDPALNYQLTAQELQARNPGVVIGSYLSGGDVRSLTFMQAYPSETIPLEQVPAQYLAGGAWGDSPLYSINLNDPAAATWFAEALVTEMAQRRAQLPSPSPTYLFMDNIRHPLSGFLLPNGQPVPWSTVTGFLAQVQAGLHAQNLRLVTNIAVSPWIMSPDDVNALQSAVDGMMFEAPFAKQWGRPYLSRVLDEIVIYRQWLAAGKLIMLVPMQGWNSTTCPPGDTVCAQIGNAHEQRVMAGMILLMREPGQSIFVARDYWRARPDWWDWPQRLGPPTGPYEVVSGAQPGEDIVLRRRFANGQVTVNLTDSLNVSTSGTAVTVEFFP